MMAGGNFAPPPALIVPSTTFNENASEWRCCCGCCHVERGACIIAIIGLVLKALALLYNAMSRSYSLTWLAAFSCLTYVMILLAQCRQTPRLYLPYLVMNAIYIVCEVVAIIFVVMGAIAVTAASPTIQGQIQQALLNNSSEIVANGTSTGNATAISQLITAASAVVLWLIAVVMAIDAIFSTWFECVVCSAYRYAKAFRLCYYSSMYNNGVVVRA